MKKISAGLCGVLLFVCVLAGCGASEDAEGSGAGASSDSGAGIAVQEESGAPDGQEESALIENIGLIMIESMENCIIIREKRALWTDAAASWTERSRHRWALNRRRWKTISRISVRDMDISACRRIR